MNMESYEKDFEKVRQMRKLQKEYFKTRSTFVLEECKKAEKEVDRMLARSIEDLDQLDLFQGRKANEALL